MLKNSRLMEQQSFHLRPVQSYPDGLAIYFLTGEKFLYQTLFCIQSLAKQSTDKFKFVLVDDGSFDQNIIKQISIQLPGAEIITKESIEQNLQKKLPIAQFPYLHHKRKVYPHIKKLTDIHTIPGNPWRLVLDSDMLFWNKPIDIINWLKNPVKPMYMLDCMESYGYSRQLMENLSGTRIPSLVNVGAIGFNNEQINWPALERWTKTLEEKEGATYYLEQALSAMLIGDSEAVVLDPSEYIVYPNEDMIRNQQGILHHYVDLAKVGYFNRAWKHYTT